MIAGRNTPLDSPTARVYAASGPCSAVFAGQDPVSKDLDELLDPHAAALRTAMDQTGVEVLRHERVLELLGQPVEHRREHLDIDVDANLSIGHPELDELQRAVGIFASHEPV